MFDRLGSFVARHWGWVLLAWMAMVGAAALFAPPWADVTKDGDFAYLPDSMTTVRGERRMEEAFPDNPSKSQIVLVVARGDGPLTSDDFTVADRLIEAYTPLDDHGPIVDVWSYDSSVIGQKLVSPAGYRGQASLIVLRLRSEFMAVGNMGLLRAIHAQLDELRRGDDFPAGLQLGVTGSAAIGADMLLAAEESIRNTELATILLVLVFLVLVYRAPILVLIPLVTIGASVSLSTNVLALLAQWSDRVEWFDFKIFTTTRIFIVVILFGAGTDFCLFLIARYREELAQQATRAAALARALSSVGGALVGSAMTTVVGLGAMIFAEFGKFSNSGPAIALCLLVALAASLTLTPALLRATGRVAFWPWGRRIAAASAAPARGNRFWEGLSRAIVRRPGTILLVSLLLLAPLAWQGLAVPINYDFLNELPPERPSVQGTNLLRQHFLAGQTGPVTVIAQDPQGGFDEEEGERRISLLTTFLHELTVPGPNGEPVRPILSIRSLTNPLGDDPRTFNPLSTAGRAKLIALKHPRTKAVFLAQTPALAGKVTRFELTLRHDPFSREAVEIVNHLEGQLASLSEDPRSDWHGAQFELLGTTAGIRDLELVTTSDRWRIQVLVVLGVLMVLVLLLREPWICVYLIVSVLFSYYVTIGAAEAFFAWHYGDTFRGLDWKVPIFLFVILIAVGQDYNIYLVTRVFEEQQRHGPIAGLRRAVVLTGGIITSCGVIMAGTFASMMTGSLRAVLELGFALALGVLLDTFIVRTVLVPAFLALWHRRTGRILASSGEAVAARPAQSPHPTP